MQQPFIYNVDGLTFIRLHYKFQETLFLLDSGASVSVFFQNYLTKDEKVNPTEKIKINGIAGSIHTLGSANIVLKIQDVEICHKFLIVDKLQNGLHGIIGTDFLQKFQAKINFENFTLGLSVHDYNITLPIETNYDFSIKIPARCEVIKYIWTNVTVDCVVLAKELTTGVYVGSTIVRPKQNLIPVRILNTNDEEIIIKNFQPEITKLNEYNICNFSNSKMSSVDRVKKLLNLINTDSLNEEEEYSIQKVCAKYADVFHLDGEPLTVTNIYKQKIHVQDSASAAYVKPYRLPQAQKQEIHKQIESMLENGIIEETRSEYSAPLLIVPKKKDQNGNQKWRVVIDYRLLNKQIKDDKFPLPCISEILDSLGGAIYFSHLDLSQGYYQIELDQESRRYTAFTTDRGQYQMTRLPMGLKISPSAFSRAMTIAMAGLNYESCFIYLDDLIVFGNNLITHNQNLTKVLQRLRDVNLKLNPYKCMFLRKQISYLGNIISEKGVSPDPEKVKAIQNYPVPKDANQTKRFVAFANYYRRYIPNFAHIASPLNELQRKGVPFIWNNECQNAFEKLKLALINPPILQYPNFSENNCFILKTDASGVALGAVLLNNDDKPVAYASRSLNKAERRYCTIEKELAALVFGVKHFRPYLYGRKFTIFTDHKPLVYLFGMTNPSSRLTKFRLILEEYDFTVKYIKGKDNVAADALSRIEISLDELKNMTNVIDSTVYAITRAQTKNLIQNEIADVETTQKKRLDHPGLVEVLKRPQDSFELQLVTEREFQKILVHEANDYVNEHLICNLSLQTIYLKQNPRSMSSLRETLRDLKNVSEEYKIPELIIIKNEKGASTLLNEILRNINEFRNAGIKISVISSVQKIVDLETRKIILNDFHLLPTGGHTGINRMYNNIKKYYFWPGLRNDIIKFVKRCDECQRFKHSKPNVEPMSITTTPSHAFQRIFLDIVGPLPENLDENRYILTLQCDLSKFVECYAIPNKEAETVAKIFVEQFILRYGIPEEIITDQGTEFLSLVFTNICKILKINKLHSTAYHHQTLGSLENSHKNLGAYLRIQISKYPESWSSWISFWSFAYNTTVHTETQYTPYELVFGKLCKLPSNISSHLDPLYNFDDYPLELKYRLQQACYDVQNNLIVSKNQRKDRYDRKSNIVNYKVGDQVLVTNETGNKMQPLFKGPYEVVEVNSPNIKISIDNKLIEIHKNRVKLYNS